MTRETIRINGMACPACAKGIEKTVGGLNGVVMASVSFDKGELSLEYDERRLPGALLRKTIGEIVNDVVEQTRRMSLDVPVYGLSCPECAARIEEILAERDGVIGASVNLRKGRAKVVYDPKKTDFQHLKHVIENAQCNGKNHREIVINGNYSCGCCD
ncbi:MAG: copper ion binding protein [Synergistaceae bacterium]|jgi:copper ion binding protein|nr:copper ion binding protein [Synergistaceae bacterium]